MAFWLIRSRRTRADSDIDLIIEKGRIKGYFQLSGFHIDLEEAFNLKLDIAIYGNLWKEFATQVAREQILIYS
jgi:predicted nucleotidyltransferase